MPAVCRLSDPCSGHGCFPSRPNVGASGNVFVNGLGAHRVGDPWDTHCCPPPCHSGSSASGSGTVFVNGMAVGRIGDPVDCGSTIAGGSGNVFAG